MRSTDSSPSDRRRVCTRCSNRFIAIWRNTVAIAPSTRSASSAEPALVVGDLGEHPPEHQLLAEHRRGLGERQRRRLVEHALGLGERGVQAVAELVRHRQHVAAGGGEVEQHVRVHARNRVRAEGAASLVRPRRRVDPVLVEEPPRDRAGRRRERLVGVEHQVARLAVRERDVLGEHRRRAVVVGQPVDPEQLRLEPVPALGNVEAISHRLDQRHHGLVGRLVGEVAARQPVRVAPQPVLDRLVVDERVVDEPARAQPRLERGRDGVGGAAPQLAIGRQQAAERDVERQLLVVEVDPERRDQLSEQAAPGRLARDRLLGEDLLLALREQVRAVAPRAVQVVVVAIERRGREQLVGAGVVDGRPLEVEEQEQRLDLGGALLDELEQRAALGVGRVGREPQARVRARAPDQLVDLLELAHRRADPVGVQVRDLAGVVGGERRRAVPALLEHPLGAGAVLAVDQRGEVPLGLEQLRVGEKVGSCGHGYGA